VDDANLDEWADEDFDDLDDVDLAAEASTEAKPEDAAACPEAAPSAAVMATPSSPATEIVAVQDWEEEEEESSEEEEEKVKNPFSAMGFGWGAPKPAQDKPEVSSVC
jgi:hypothetical protein